MEVAINAEKVIKTYKTGKTTLKALDGISITINRGEFMSIMGPSGSGKTTLLNVLGALDRPSSGSVTINGIQISAIPERKLYSIRRKHVGFIFQNYYLVPTLTALDNVLMPALPMGITNKIYARACELLDKVGLKDRMNHRPTELSGGEQQRVAIARSMVLNPTVVFADEPTGNLDTRTGFEVFKLMRELNEEKGTTFVIVTHDPRVAGHTERTLYMRDGRLSQSPTVIEDWDI